MYKRTNFGSDIAADQRSFLDAVGIGHPPKFWPLRPHRDRTWPEVWTHFRPHRDRTCPNIKQGPMHCLYLTNMAIVPSAANAPKMKINVSLRH